MHSWKKRMLNFHSKEISRKVKLISSKFHTYWELSKYKQFHIYLSIYLFISICLSIYLSILTRPHDQNLTQRDVSLNTCQRRWMIGRCGERGSGISVLAARHDDDDDQVSMSIFSSRSVHKLATIVEGNPKAPFSIATTPMCRGGR